MIPPPPPQEGEGVLFMLVDELFVVVVLIDGLIPLACLVVDKGIQQLSIRSFHLYVVLFLCRHSKVFCFKKFESILPLVLCLLYH